MLLNFLFLFMIYNEKKCYLNAESAY